MSSIPSTRSGPLLYSPQHHDAPPTFSYSPPSTSISSDGRLVDKSLLRRFFSRSRPRLVETDTLYQPRSSPVSRSSSLTTAVLQRKPVSADAFVMNPSPHTHPLLSKPSARDEYRPWPQQRYTTTSHSMRNRSSHHAGKKCGSLVAPARRNDDNRDERSSGSSTSSSVADVHEVYTRNLRDRERIALNAAMDGHVPEWGFFVKCYAEGRFNISNPPDPPPRRPDFVYLTAPAPPEERQRLLAVKSFNVSLPSRALEKCRRLVLLARKVFQTRMAAISLVDEHDEMVKAEHSFGVRFIDRSDSIAAHVLLANEPMVILDTAKDWRLQGNPLVQGGPHIRFYAGAPIVTYEGHAIGVVAVFDSQPRVSFPAASRRKLLDFARLVMTEFEMVVEECALPSVPTPTTRIFKRPMDIDPAMSDAESVKSRRGRLTEKLIRGIEEDARKMDDDCPFPAGEASEVLPDSPHKPNARPQGWCRRDPPSALVLHDDMPDSAISIQTPPLSPGRPYSISTVTSSGSSASGDVTPRPNSPTPTPRNSLESMAPSFLQEATMGSDSHFYGSDPPTCLTEASFATSIIARSLSYDLVYLLRVTTRPTPPSCPLIPENPLRERTAVETKVIVSHGLPDPPPVFDAALHLRAIRSLGGLIYQNPIRETNSNIVDTVGYRMGILLPLARYDNGGIVLAAFSANAVERFEPDEVRFLKEFGEAMRDILVKADEAAVQV